MQGRPELRDRAAIVGVGATSFTRRSGVSTAALAQEAIFAAVEDAGLSMRDIDGIASFGLGDSVGANLLAPMLGIRDLRYYLYQYGGGSQSHTIVAEAAMACISGVADYVVCFRALNSNSGIKTGTFPVALLEPELRYSRPHGFYSAFQQFAMAARAHMNRFGTRPEHLGHVAVSGRANAALNERAMMREPITLEDYFASRWIAEPFRLLDCCLTTDGACAVVVTRTELARALARRPVLISGAVWGPGQTRFSNGGFDLTETGVRYSAPRLYSTAGVGPEEVDLALLYDAFTYNVIVQLEDFGFCPKGEGGPFVASGAITRKGSLPVNTSGGMLSEGYIHGFNNVIEAVVQLRGDAGARQIAGAEIALSSGEGGLLSGNTSSLILRAA